MPRGPKGEKRPADVIGAAIMVGRIATGEIEDNRLDSTKESAAVQLGRRGDSKAAKLARRTCHLRKGLKSPAKPPKLAGTRNSYQK